MAKNKKRTFVAIALAGLAIYGLKKTLSYIKDIPDEKDTNNDGEEESAEEKAHIAGSIIELEKSLNELAELEPYKDIFGNNYAICCRLMGINREFNDDKEFIDHMTAVSCDIEGLGEKGFECTPKPVKEISKDREAMLMELSLKELKDMLEYYESIYSEEKISQNIKAITEAIGIPLYKVLKLAQKGSEEDCAEMRRLITEIESGINANSCKVIYYEDIKDKNSGLESCFYISDNDEADCPCICLKNDKGTYSLLGNCRGYAKLRG